MWLVPDDGSLPIRFETKASIDSFVMVDRRATFKPLNRNINVSVVYGQEGASGTFTGLLSAQQNQPAAITRLKAIRTNPYARPRLVWGISIPVEVSNVKILPAADYTAGQAVWNVSFDFMQAGS